MLIDGIGPEIVDDIKYLIRGEEFVLSKNPLFKKTITYEGFGSFGDYNVFTFKREIPLIAKGLRKLFGQERGNYLGQYVSQELLNERDLDCEGISVWKRHPNFLKVRFR